MSPTSYQTAPPRISKGADYKDAAKALQGAVSKDFLQFRFGISASERCFAKYLANRAQLVDGVLRYT